MTIKIVSFLVLSALFCQTTAKNLISFKSTWGSLASSLVDLSSIKQQANVSKCVQNLEFCDFRHGTVYFHNAESDAAEYCRNSEPYYTCFDGAVSRCSTSDFEMSSKLQIFIQLVEGEKDACRDPRIAEVLFKPETMQCITQKNRLEFKKEPESCWHQYIHALRQQDANIDICGIHDRFVDCLGTALSDNCSPESWADVLYLIDVTFGGKFCERGASGGSPVKYSTFLLRLLPVVTVFLH